MYSNGIRLGMARYGNESKDLLDKEHRIEARLDKHETAPDDIVMNPGHVDEAKWEKAKKAAEKSGYKDKYAVVTEIYKKMGGTFSHKSK